MDDDANIIVGSALDSDLDGIVRVSVVATGVEADSQMAFIREGYQAQSFNTAPAVATSETLVEPSEIEPPVTAGLGVKPVENTPPPMPIMAEVEAQTIAAASDSLPEPIGQRPVDVQTPDSPAQETTAEFELPPLSAPKNDVPSVKTAQSVQAPSARPQQSAQHPSSIG